MKITQLLVTLSLLTAANTEGQKPGQKEFLERASAQLDRLAPYRRSADWKPSETLPTEQEQTVNAGANSEVTHTTDEERVAIEIYQILPENVQKDIVKRISKNEAISDLLSDPRYAAMLQERIKRSGNKYGVHKRQGYADGGYGASGYGGDSYGGGGDGYGGGGDDYGKYGASPGSAGIIAGSGKIITGIASGLIGGIVSASAGASKGSSAGSSGGSSEASHQKPPYGPTYSNNDKKNFGVWDFKKAIINTLVQAIKAISGGVVALKGQLIKGSGFLISTKGKIISSTGDAITSLGRNIASSAVVSPPKYQPHPGYSYGHPQIQHTGHDATYDGPPPSAEEYSGPPDDYSGHANFGSPTDDDDQAGLLIVKPTKPDPDNQNEYHLDLDQRNPPSSPPENSYGPPKGSPDKDVENGPPSNPDSYSNPNQGNQGEPHQNFDHPPPIYVSPNHYSVGNKVPDSYPSYPPANFELPTVQSSGHGNHLSIEQSAEYPPIHLQYTVPDKTPAISGGDLTKGDTSANDLSIYSSLSFDVNPQIDTIKISTLRHGDTAPKLQVNFHDMPSFANLQAGSLMSHPQDPLRIPILNPMPMNYWHSPGLLEPIGNFGVHSLHRRRSNLQKRRIVEKILRQPTLPLQNTRLHRV